jgi:hypothetical protein
MSTTVVNVYKDLYDVYIGRPGKNQSGFFGNPFHSDNRDENIVRFKDYFYNRLKTDPQFRYKVHQLKDKRLGCFCKPHNSCHGDIIAQYLNNISTIKINLGVVGSRGFNDYDFMCDILQWYEVKSITSGGAPGADRLAARYAIEHQIPLKEFLAEWDKLGKRAGYVRNEKIVDAVDEIVAFWDTKSKGTKHTIDIAEREGKPVAIYWPDYEDDFLMNIGFKG